MSSTQASREAKAIAKIRRLTQNYSKDLHGCDTDAQRALVYGIRLTKIRKVLDGLAP